MCRPVDHVEYKEGRASLVAWLGSAAQGLFSRVVQSLITITVTAILGGLGSLLVALTNHAEAALAVGIGLSVFAVVLVIGWAIMVAVRKHALIYVTYPPQGFHFKVLKKTIKYEVGDSGDLRFSRSVELKALTDAVDRFTDRFLWTGGTCGLPEPGMHVSDVRENRRTGIWTYYDAYFDRTLRRGEEITISNIWPVIANARVGRPFVSSGVEEPTDTLVFDIRIPPKYRRDDRLLLEELRSIESINPFKTTEGTFNHDTYRVEIKVRPYTHYRIRWSWANEAPVQAIRGTI